MSVWLGLDFWDQDRRFSESWYRDFRWFMVRLQWNWKILLFLRPRLVKMMRRRLYPESCWSLCCHATHYHEIWIVWGCDLGGQVIQIPTTILTQASALQSVVVRQSTGNNNQGVLLKGGGHTMDVIKYISCLQITSDADYIGDCQQSPKGTYFFVIGDL